MEKMAAARCGAPDQPVLRVRPGAPRWM